MEQTALLWEYQQADMAADEFEAEIKRSPNRLAVQKKRNFLMDQQNAVKKMEQEISNMSDRLDVIRAAAEKIEEQLAALAKRVEEAPPATLDEVTQVQKDAQKLSSDLTQYEAEIQHIQQETTTRERQEKEIRVKFAKTKAEYDEQKVAYEAELKEQMKELDKKRAIAAEKEKDLDPVLLEKYRSIKKHSIPPVARLYSGQCGGCNMNLPQVSLRKFKNDVPYIECENCGRLIIQ